MISFLHMIARVSAVGVIAVLASLTPALALSQQDKDDLARVQNYLNGIKTLTGKFSQITSDGAFSQGTFKIKKPGRLRFEYAPPETISIIADGFRVAVTNTELKTQQAIPISETPLGLLLDDDLDLVNDVDVTSVLRRPGQLTITAKQSEGIAQGAVTMIFSDPGLELRHWITTDAQGTEVTVAISDLRRDVEVPSSIFHIEDVQAPGDDY
jgi:outer membrane lipoprotein-sorting protein